MRRFALLAVVMIMLSMSACFESQPSPKNSATHADTESVDTSGLMDDQLYLVKAEKLEGVQKTASGLLYKVIKTGSGDTPTAANRVEVHYEGKLIDGTVFDSSYARGQTASFGVSQVIAGWTEGLQLMQVGAVYEFIIPSELGYGSRGAGADIPPHATLIFRVELIAVK